MMCPSWNITPYTPSQPCGSAAEARTCDAPVQWWFWILAAALAVSVATGGNK